jgi:hypothetical protein
VNFVSGWTYASAVVGPPENFQPFADAVPSIFFAAPLLGLRVEYRTADDSDLFLRAIRREISLGFPPHVTANATTLSNGEGLLPRARLVVGYDDVGFVECLDPLASAEEGRRRVSAETFALACRQICEVNGQPWKYAYLVYRSTNRIGAPEEVFRRNGRALVGEGGWPVRRGAAAVHKLAEGVRKRAKTGGPGGRIGKALRVASQSREEGANYLARMLGGDARALRASALLRESAQSFARAAELLREGAIEKEAAGEAASFLDDSAAADEAAGRLLLELGGTNAAPGAGRP